MLVVGLFRPFGRDGVDRVGLRQFPSEAFNHAFEFPLVSFEVPGTECLLIRPVERDFYEMTEFGLTVTDCKPDVYNAAG